MPAKILRKNDGQKNVRIAVALRLSCCAIAMITVSHSRHFPRGNTCDGAFQNLNAKNSATGVVTIGIQHSSIGSVTSASAIES